MQEEVEQRVVTLPQRIYAKLMGQNPAVAYAVVPLLRTSI